jgi:hypothetical protein
MIRSSGCSWLCRQPWTTSTCDLPVHDPKLRVLTVAGTAMDNRYFGSCPPPVGRLDGRARSCRSIVSAWSVARRWARRSRPGPPGARPVIRASRVVAPVRLTSSPCGGGWVGCTTVPWGCSGGRPRRGHRPVSTRPSCRVPRDRLWSRPSTPLPLPWMPRPDHPRDRAHTWVHDQQDRDTNCRGAEHQLQEAARVPVPLITPQNPGPARGRRRDHSQSSGTQPRRSRRERACPRASGTATRATTRFGSAPNPATPARRRGRGEPARTRR